MAKAITRYICRFCGEEYDNESAADKCEAQGVDEAIVQVGDIVTLGKGFGWYDGDERWVTNPEVRMNMHGTGLSSHQVPPKKPCPKRSSNCFDSCCCFEFYYVVTRIDTSQDHSSDPGHRCRYHVETLAMSGKNGYRGPGYTFNEGHHLPVLVKNPPAIVVEQSKALIGHKAKHLF